MRWGPTCSITLTEAQKVIGVVMTSSPGRIPRVARAVCSPAVQELSASAPGAPTNAANSRSNARVLGPVVIHADLSVSTTSSISLLPDNGWRERQKRPALRRGGRDRSLHARRHAAAGRHARRTVGGGRQARLGLAET